MRLRTHTHTNTTAEEHTLNNTKVIWKRQIEKKMEESIIADRQEKFTTVEKYVMYAKYADSIFFKLKEQKHRNPPVISNLNYTQTDVCNFIVYLYLVNATAI